MNYYYYSIAIFPENAEGLFVCLFVESPGERLRADRQSTVCVNSSN